MGGVCYQSCRGCINDCDDRTEYLASYAVKPHERSSIKKVIGIVSGREGVGKSVVTSYLAVTMQRRGFNIAILDADITRPAIPKSFGLSEFIMTNNGGFYPCKTSTGIDVMSLNLLVGNEVDYAGYKGPILANMVKWFWSEVIWNDVDYMFVDMPPGTGSEALKVFQSLPFDGIVITASQKEDASEIVSNAVNMAKKLGIPILGLVVCPGCDENQDITQERQIEIQADDFADKVLARLPVDPKLSAYCEKGKIEQFGSDCLESIADALAGIL